jgi:hypothetical protein
LSERRVDPVSAGFVAFPFEKPTLCVYLAFECPGAFVAIGSPIASLIRLGAVRPFSDRAHDESPFVACAIQCGLAEIAFNGTHRL